jgi:CRP/FNR family transcriptional regulator, transcriptional activator FtrB
MTTMSLAVITARIERLANWILQEDRNRGGRGRFIIGRNKRRLSALLGIAPETLMRYFAGLSAHGVTVGGKEIIIADRRALQRLLFSFHACLGL